MIKKISIWLKTMFLVDTLALFNYPDNDGYIISKESYNKKMTIRDEIYFKICIKIKNFFKICAKNCKYNSKMQ